MNTLNRIIVVVMVMVLTVLCCALSVGAKWVVPPMADQMTMWAESLEDTAPAPAVGIGAAIAFQPVENIGYAFFAEDVVRAGTGVVDRGKISSQPMVVPAFGNTSMVACNQVGSAILSADAENGILFIHITGGRAACADQSRQQKH